MIVLFMILLIVITVPFLIGGLLGAVWVPAFSEDTTAILKHLKLRPGMTLYEFGCGDGRFLRKASKYKVNSVGYEVNPYLCKLAQIRSIHNKNTRIKQANAWNKSFAEADVVFTFLMPKFMEKFGTKMQRELKSGSIVVSYIFEIPNMEHYRHANNSYFYKIK
ncbi:class I SAM-dependent methyltransferase [Candidatus Saccharibacteria bacterium]|jgi:SAM-dependent methyltransferase|nr:class I SAM-dependent methyltransferase [Candidatus Saccharibacteria bacterium]MBP9131611.1 class I SAM-dependent methyltransferase [Candidatus Saccharibacteria bacterium]